MRRQALAAIVGLLAAVVLASPSAAQTTTQPTLTLQRDCSLYPPFHSVDASLSGFPANTPFMGTIFFPGGGSAGPVSFSTDASGNFRIGPLGSTLAGTFAAEVVWSGGTLRESLDVNCAAPATAEECKNGGWHNFPGFRNQGDCVSFVATHGKSPPAGT